MKQIEVQQSAADKFDIKQFQILGVLGELMKLRASGFGVDPDNIDWGHVGDLGRIHGLLQEALAVAKGTMK